MNVTLHPLLGVGVAVSLAVAVRRRGSPPDSWLGAGLACVAIGLATGVAVVFVRATGASLPLLYVHVATSGLGALLVAVHVWQVSSAWPEVRAVRAAIVLALLALAVAPSVRSWQRAAWTASYRPTNPAQAPATMAEEGGGPTSPFFPSSANTTTGDVIPAGFFLTSDMCGRCHKDIYDQWNS